MRLIIFYIKCLLIIFITFTICYGILLLNPEFDRTLTSSIKLKHQKLKKINTNKIIVVGGSNVSFGVDSNQMENGLNIPVVNMGVSAGVGSSYYLEFIKDNLIEGDIVLFSPEYNTLGKDKWYGMSGTSVSKIVIFTPSKAYVILKDYKLFRKVVNGLSRTVKAYWKEFPFPQKGTTINSYSFEASNKDNINSFFLRGNFSKKFSKKVDLIKNEEAIAFKELINFQKYFAKKGIDFYLTPPAAIDEKFNEDNVNSYMKFLSEKSGIKLLNEKNSYLFKRKYFLNTEYHLNKKGREIRTDLLIRDVELLKRMGQSKGLTKIKTVKRQNATILPLSGFTNNLNFKVNRKSIPRLIDIEFGKNNSWNFTRTKIEGIRYHGNLIQFKVEASQKIIDGLDFKGAAKSEFDLIKKNDTNIYVLSKKLINVSIHYKGNTFLGLTSKKNTLLAGSHFKILEVKLWEENIYSDIFKNENIPERFKIPEEIDLFVIEVNNIDEDFKVSQIFNINSAFNLNQGKYEVIKSKKFITIRNFYKKEILLQLEIKNDFELEVKALDKGWIDILY